jgi:hypothetical protein
MRSRAYPARPSAHADDFFVAKCLDDRGIDHRCILPRVSSMTAPTKQTRVVIALGCAQTLAWGSTYYLPRSPCSDCLING